MRTAKKLTCASCGRRIRTHQTDLILENASGGKPRYYHGYCQQAAYAMAMRRPAVYVLTVRHADPCAN